MQGSVLSSAGDAQMERNPKPYAVVAASELHVSATMGECEHETKCVQIHYDIQKVWYLIEFCQNSLFL